MTRRTGWMPVWARAWASVWGSWVERRRVRAVWRGAHGLAELGALTARWLDGELPTQPHHDGPPDPETIALVPVLAGLNRSGFVTSGSQPGLPPGPGFDNAIWAQRAAVEGFADSDLVRRLEAWLPDGLVLIVHSPDGGYHSPGLTVTTRAGQPYTMFGGYLEPRLIRWLYSDCNKATQSALVDAHQVTIVDPVWGRNDVLWPALQTLAASLTTSLGAAAQRLSAVPLSRQPASHRSPGEPR